jgi:4-amino-4-deoxy-L-arabinose transferase-like glycosyltransferase
LDADSYDKGIYYAFRTPGFAVIYYPIRLFFNFHSSLYIVIFLQILLNVITKYLLCLLVFRITKNRIAFFLGVLFFMFSIHSSFYNNFLLTESFASFFLITSLYLFYKGLNSKNKWTFLWSGLFLTEAMLLRPFLAPLFLPLVILIYLQFKKENIKILILLFLFPLIIFESFWLPRNYIKSGEFIPLSKTMDIFEYSNKAFLSQKKIIENLSVSGEWWVKSSPTYWFTKKDDKRSPLSVYPKIFFTNYKDTSLLINAKKNYLKSTDSSYPIKMRSDYESLASNQLIELNNRFELKNKYIALTSRFYIALNMINQPLLKPFISLQYPFNVFSVALESFLLRFTFIFGFISTIIAIFRFRKNYFILFLAIIPLFIFLLFSFIMRHFEFREMYLPSFFFLFFGIEMISCIIINKKNTFLITIFSLLLLLVYFDVMNNVKF